MIKVQSTVYPEKSEAIKEAEKRISQNVPYSAIINYWELNGRFNDSLFKRIASIKSQVMIELIS